MSYPPQHIIAARCTVTAAATAVPAAVVAEAAYSTLLSLQPLLDCSRRLVLARVALTMAIALRSLPDGTSDFVCFPTLLR